MGRKRQPPSAARPSVGTARHRGRLAWDDPPLIDLPVLPLARTTSHPSEQALAGEPVFEARLPGKPARLPPECRFPPRLPASVLDGARDIGLAAPADRRPRSLRPCDHRSWLARFALISGLATLDSRSPRLPLISGLATLDSGLPRRRLASGLAAFDSSSPSIPGLRRTSELCIIPRLVVLPDPDQARPRGLRRPSSPGGPDRRAIRCVITMPATKHQVKRYF